MTIADEVTACATLYNKLLRASISSSTGSSATAPVVQFNDEFGRFKLWAGNLGAHRVGRSSLSYRLRDASHLQKTVLFLLSELQESLSEMISIVTGERELSNKSPTNSDSESDFNEHNSDEKERFNAQTELDQLASTVVEITNSLLRLSVAIQNPAPHDRFFQTASRDTSHFEPFDIDHVRSKFSHAPDFLVERLGRVISRRRHFFRYREQHHAKISANIDTILDETYTEARLESTVASSIPLEMKMQQVAITKVDFRAEESFSQTSYASSAAGSVNARVPPMPKEGESDQPFECPFCFMIISCNGRKSWKKHVFSDLQPYVCTWEDCTTPECAFSRRHDWIAHEKRAHWSQWKCPLGCDIEPLSAQQLESHICSTHKVQSGNTQVESVVDSESSSTGHSAKPHCPLCREDLASSNLWERHVGRHQEHLSLFALPTPDPDRHDDINDAIMADVEDANLDVHNWVDDWIPSYRLTSAIVVDFLMEVFPGHLSNDFNVRFQVDNYCFTIPRKLTNTERMELRGRQLSDESE